MTFLQHNYCIGQQLLQLYLITRRQIKVNTLPKGATQQSTAESGDQTGDY